MATTSKTTGSTTRRVTVPVQPSTDPPPRAEPPVSVLADREAAAKAVKAQVSGWATAAAARRESQNRLMAELEREPETVTRAGAAMAAEASRTFNDGVRVQHGVLEPEEAPAIAVPEGLTDEEITAALADALARKRAVERLARTEAKPVAVGETENLFVANLDFGYGDEFKPHGLSRGQVFELRGYKNDQRLVEMGYCRPLTKRDTIYECNIDGGKFIDITYRTEHVRRCYADRDDLQQDQYEDERQAHLAEVAHLKIPGAETPTIRI